MKSSVLLALLPAAVLAYSDIKDGSLKSHNQYRTEHSAPALTWNEDAARAAQAHADKCQYGHSNNNEYGENIAAGYDSIEKAITAWGDEREKYDFGNQGFSSECGHFTQIVWKDTTTVGCGAALCDGILGSGKQWFHVCNYHTAGNVQGQYEKNVSPKTNGYKQKPVDSKPKGDKPKGDKPKGGKPTKKPEFEYEDEPTEEPSYADAEPDYETDTDNDVYSDNDSYSDDEYDSDNTDDYSGKKWKPAHKKWNSRNKWNPYKKTSKYSKFNKWNTKKFTPKHNAGKHGKWGNRYDNSPKTDSYDNGKWDSGKYDSY